MTEAKPVKEKEGELKCEKCGKVVRGKAALGVHVAFVHNRKKRGRGKAKAGRNGRDFVGVIKALKAKSRKLRKEADKIDRYIERITQRAAKMLN